MRKAWFICYCFLIVILLVVALWGAVRFYFIPISSQSNPLQLIIPKNATVEQMAAQLQAKGAKRDLYYFLLLAKWLGKLKQVKAGEYLIPASSTPQRLLEMLSRGQVLLHKITFPEGWTFKQFIAALQANPNLSHNLQDQSDAQIMASIGHANEHPEGVFYPDTYLFSIGTQDRQILGLAYDLMQKKLAQAWAGRARNTLYKTAYEALIVASMIEKETAVASERPRVAAVILNRLKTGMRLQIDATVLYGLNDKSRRVLRRSDLATATPYNTYTQSGLPPTPIAMPGLSSISAALHPATEAALYYVAKGGGGHIFSNTLKDHQVAVQAYRQRLTLAPVAENNRLGCQLVCQCVAAPLLLHFWLSWSESP